MSASPSWGLGHRLTHSIASSRGLDLPEPEAGNEFLAFGEGAVNDGAVLAGDVDAGAFGRGVKTIVA